MNHKAFIKNLSSFVIYVKTQNELCLNELLAFVKERKEKTIKGSFETRIVQKISTEKRYKIFFERVKLFV